MPKKFTNGQTRLVRVLVSKNTHPDFIDHLLGEFGVQNSELEEAYSELNLSRSSILRRYKIKRNTRFSGVGISVLAFVLSIDSSLGAGGQGMILAIGLFLYGIAIALTGSFLVVDG